MILTTEAQQLTTVNAMAEEKSSKQVSKQLMVKLEGQDRIKIIAKKYGSMIC